MQFSLKPLAFLALVACSTEDISTGSHPLFTSPPVRINRLVASDPMVGAEFGDSVASIKDQLFVGAPNSNGGRGVVYVFTASAGGWVETQRLTSLNEPSVHNLGVSVSGYGDVLAVGAPTHPSGGAVLIFRRSQNGWTFNQRLVPPRPELAAAYFGYTLELKDGLLVTSTGLNPSDPRPGIVHVYREKSSQFAFEQDLIPTESASEDQFGASYAIDGDQLAIGASSAFRAPGRAYVFRKHSTGWREEQRLTAGSGLDLFGWSIAMSGSRLVVGAPVSTTPAHGALYAYEKRGPAWEVAQVIAGVSSGLGPYSGSLGRGVAINGDQLAATNLEAVFTFRAGAGGQWLDDARYLPAVASPPTGEIAMGTELEFKNDVLAVGNRLDAVNGRQTGAVNYVFLKPRSPVEAGVPIDMGSDAGSSDAGTSPPDANVPPADGSTMSEAGPSTSDGLPAQDAAPQDASKPKDVSEPTDAASNDGGEVPPGVIACDCTVGASGLPRPALVFAVPTLVFVFLSLRRRRRNTHRL